MKEIRNFSLDYMTKDGQLLYKCYQVMLPKDIEVMEIVEDFLRAVDQLNGIPIALIEYIGKFTIDELYEINSGKLKVDRDLIVPIVLDLSAINIDYMN